MGGFGFLNGHNGNIVFVHIFFDFVAGSCFVETLNVKGAYGERLGVM